MKSIKNFTQTLLFSYVAAQVPFDYEASTLGFANAKFDMLNAFDVSASITEPTFTIDHHFEAGSNLEQAREIAQTLPITEAVMNDSVKYSIFPSTEDTFQRSSDGRYVRRIYSGIELTDQESGLIEGFRNWLQTKNLSLPKGYLDDHNYALRYLNTTKGDFQAAYDLIIQKENWLVDDFIPNLENIDRHTTSLETGGLYAYGRDKQMHPIVI